MYQLSKENHEAAIAKIDKLQCQIKPLLTKRVFEKTKRHDVMLFQNGERNGNQCTFAAVKGKENWAMYYCYGFYSDRCVATNGHKMSITDVKKVIDIEEGLEDLYRK